MNISFGTSFPRLARSLVLKPRNLVVTDLKSCLAHQNNIVFLFALDIEIIRRGVLTGGALRQTWEQLALIISRWGSERSQKKIKNYPVDWKSTSHI